MLPIGVRDDALPDLTVLLVDVVLECEPHLGLLAVLEQPLEHAEGPLGGAPGVRADVFGDAREHIHLVVAVVHADTAASGGDGHGFLGVCDGFVVEGDVAGRLRFFRGRGG